VKPNYLWLAAISGGWGAIVSCGISRSTPNGPSHDESDREQTPGAVAQSQSSRSSERSGSPVFFNCLLGNATIKGTRHRETEPGKPPGPVTEDGSCVIGASCIGQQGKNTPGDGSVGLRCANGQCSCLLEPLTPPGPSVEFHFPATCMTYERAKQLMLEHCLKDMHLAPRASVDAGG
jgi:hypothetical protein